MAYPVWRRSCHLIMSRVGGAGVLLVEVLHGGAGVLLVEVLHRGAGVLLHWSWIGIACKGFISCGGWQPPAERWNIIRHLDSHKLIIIAVIWKNHNITSLLAASGYVIDVKSWERVECVIWSQIDYYQVSRVHNTLVQLLLLFLIPSNSKQIDVPYCPILITVAIEHYFWNFWSRQNKYMDKTQKIIMHRLYRAGTQGRDVFSVCTEHIGERSPVFCTLCSWTQSTRTQSRGTNSCFSWNWIHSNLSSSCLLLMRMVPHAIQQPLPTKTVRNDELYKIFSCFSCHWQPYWIIHQPRWGMGGVTEWILMRSTIHWKVTTHHTPHRSITHWEKFTCPFLRLGRVNSVIITVSSVTQQEPQLKPQN